MQSSRCAVASVRVALVWSSLLASVATARMLAASVYVALGGFLLLAARMQEPAAEELYNTDSKLKRMHWTVTRIDMRFWL